MEKEDTLSKSKVFHILEKEPERVRLEPKILYEGGSLDPMKNRIFIEVAGEYVQTSFHLCESCPKTSMARLIKVKNAVRHSLVSHSKVHEKSKVSKNPITKHFSSIYFAGRYLYNGGNDKLKSCITNPVLCLYYLNHSNRHLGFWKIRKAIEQTENLCDTDKKQMLTCLNNIQRFV